MNGQPRALSTILRRAVIFGVVLLVQFAIIEAGLRLYSKSEGSETFQSLFVDDPAVGHRLRPGASIRYNTDEFTTDIAVNGQGVRDDEPIGPKAPNERRIVVLGDSLVLSVQVPFAQTFCEHLERRLNAKSGDTRWRVINGGVQGYGPVQDWLFFDKIAAQFQPDVVLIVAFVGNDAIEAYDLAAALKAGRAVETEQPAVSRLRELMRASMTLQNVRLRWSQLKARFAHGTPERPLTSYLADPPPEVAAGLEITRDAFGRIVARASGIGAKTGIVLFPARFQTDDPDFGRLAEIVKQGGDTLVRNAASDRFRQALAPLGVPMIDLQPALAAEPNRIELFFQRNVHLTPRGHDVVSGVLFNFLETSGLTAPGR